MNAQNTLTHEDKWAQKRQDSIQDWRKRIAEWDWFVIKERCKVTPGNPEYLIKPCAFPYKLGTRAALMNRDYRGWLPDCRRRDEYCFERALAEVAAQHGLTVEYNDEHSSGAIYARRYLPADRLTQEEMVAECIAASLKALE